jgi:hypothetical protein
VGRSAQVGERALSTAADAIADAVAACAARATATNAAAISFFFVFSIRLPQAST